MLPDAVLREEIHSEWYWLEAPVSGMRGTEIQPRMKATLPSSQTKPSCASAKDSVIAINSVGADGIA